MYHETLSGQGYDNIEYVTDITWEDLEEIGIKKLGTPLFHKPFLTFTFNTFNIMIIF